jgi:hypothetical protein
MKKLFTVLCVLGLALNFSCGGSGSDISTDDVNAISAALTGTLNDCMGELDPSDIDINYINELVNINAGFYNAVDLEHQCPVDGHITASGNISGTYNTDTGSGSYSAMITFQVSDPTNNLNDCEVGSGIILDGTLNLVLTGTITPSSNTSLTTLIGTIGINRRGETGGLVMVASDCYINLRFTETGGSGTICGHEVSTN